MMVHRNTYRESSISSLSYSPAATIPQKDVENIKSLLYRAESLYWTRQDVFRYSFVPPIVCAADHHLHHWRESCSLTLEETREESSAQLHTLKDFREHTSTPDLSGDSQ